MHTHTPIHFHSDARKSRVGFRGRKSKAGNGRAAFSTVSVGNVAAAARGREGFWCGVRGGGRRHWHRG